MTHLHLLYPFLSVVKKGIVDRNEVSLEKQNWTKD